MSYRLRDFDYSLPQELIAQKPAHPRDHARLLVYDRASGSIEDDYFYHLDRWLPEASSLVVNNSRVEKCRFLFEGGLREVFVINRLNNRMVEALVRPGKKFRKGRTVKLAEGVEARVIDVADDGVRTLEISPELDHPIYDPFRATPFPPYIEQDETLSDEYQTIYAQDSGSKAAPTAGLHFTDELIRRLRQRGFGWEEITLHVGLGTFAPVKTERVDDHQMHSEGYRIDSPTADRLNKAPHRVAVGTTSVRVLESAASSGFFQACRGETDIFIRPGYKFTSVDSIITNFHLPKSTLLMLVAAFTGLEEMHRIYRHAIEKRYRFYSFGDAMLIL